MSPLWRDEIAIYLAPRKLALVRRRGLTRRIVAATEVAVEAGASGDIGPVLARLGEVLTDSTWHGGAARVVVADQAWARYGVVPSPGARLEAAGRVPHARYVLGDAYGFAVADWAVTLADEPPGRSYLACAMPPALRPALEDALAPAGLTLVSLQPQLVVAFNGWRRRLPSDDAWFVTVDDAWLGAVYLSRGGWDRVHVMRISQDWTVEIERLQALGRLTRRAGCPPGRMFVDAAPFMRRGGAPTPEIEWLEGDGPDAEQPRPIALLRRMWA